MLKLLSAQNPDQTAPTPWHPGAPRWLFALIAGIGVFAAGFARPFAAAPVSAVAPGAPAIIEQPSDEFALVGASVTFHAGATGEEPLSYQWQLNGSSLPGANAPTLTLPNLQLVDAGSYAVRVSNTEGTTMSRLALLTVSAQVRLRWNAEYRNSDGGSDTDPRIVLDSTGRVILLGASEGQATGIDFITAAYSPLGVQLWANRFNSGSNRNDFPVSLGVDGADRVYITGHTRGEAEHSRFSTVKYDTDGTLLWHRLFGKSSESDDEPKGLAAMAGGRIYVTGLSGDDGATVGYTAAGEEEWRAFFDSGSFERPQSIAVDGGGNVYIGVWEEDFLNPDLWVVKYAPDGHELWRTNYDSGGNDRLLALKLDGNGNIYVAGQIPGSGGEDDTADSSDLVVVKLSPDGQLQWAARYRGVQHSRETPVALAVDEAGNSWVAFLFDIPGSGTAVQHFGLVKFSPVGQQLWLATLRTPELSSIYDVKPDTTGNIYLTGLAHRPATGADMATTKFDAVGTRLWTVFYDAAGSGEDYGTSLALAPNGTLFVAGVSSVEGQDANIVLVSYEQMDVPGAPILTAPPGNVRAGPGATVRFQVAASGAAPLHYQWFRKGTALEDATNAVLTLTGVDFEQEGLYAVVVSNPFGLIRSADAVLQVLAPPVISQQPSALQTVVGGDAAFTVASSGGTEVTYQWRWNGQALPGATNSMLRLSHLQPAQSGDYSVEISNGVTSVLSQSARLTVSQANSLCRELNFLANGLVQGPVITSDMCGNVYVAATEPGLANADYRILKYAPDGQLLWRASYDFPGGEGDYLSSIAVDGAGHVFVTGSSLQAGFPYNVDFATIKYDAQGHELWVQRYESGTGNDFAAKLALDTNGNVFVIGTSERYDNGIPGTAWVTVKYAPDGAEQWVLEYRGAGLRYDTPRDLTVDPAGNLFVTGSSDGPSWNGDMVTVKYDTNGRELWQARYESTLGGASALALDGAGNIVVAGYSIASDGNEIVTLKYNSLGLQLWSARYHDPAQQGTSARAIATDASGNIIVTGDSGGSIATLKYAPNGEQLWATRFSGPRRNVQTGPRDLAMDAAGNIHLAGIVSGAESGTLDLITLHYDPSGNRRWVARLLGATSEPFRPGLVVHSSGTVTAVGAFGNVLRTISYCPNNAPGAPSIVIPPRSQHAVMGSTVMFTVTANGDGLSYQWYFDGNPVAGAVGASYSVANVTPANSGTYSVEVYSSVGSLLSPEATLIVDLPPTMVTRPSDTCVNIGTAARFQVTASGDPPLTYQWSFAGAALAGATNSLLILSHVQPEQAGLYTVLVSNPFGSAAAQARLSLVPHVQQLWAGIFANFQPTGEALNDEPTYSAVDPAGNVYVTGSSLQPGFINAPTDIFVAKFDTNGARQWVAHRPASNQRARWPNALAVNAAGEAYLAMEDSTDPTAPSLLKFSAAGELLWSASFGGAAASALALDTAGNAFVATRTFGLVKVSAGGTQLWSATHPQASARAVALDSSGNIYVSGAAFAPAPWPGPGNDYLTVKYNGSGQEQWSRTWRSPEGGDNQAAAIAVDTLDQILVTGQYVIPAGPGLPPRLGIGTIKYDSNGNALWFTNYGGIRSTDVPVGLKLDKANNVVIIASSENFEDGGPQWATLKYSTDGILQWARGVAGAISFSQRPGGLALDSARNVYVTGAVIDESAQPIITTVKYGPEGNDIWTARFQESAWSGLGYGATAIGVHLAPAGRVLVAGAIGWHDRDILVLAYAQESSSNAPVLLQSPRALVVTAGTPAILSVVFSNATHVQWQHNGVAIPGATNAVLLLTSPLPEDSGRYSVRLANGDYCVETAGARLVVEAGPQPYLLPQLNATDHGLEIRFVALPYASYILQASSDLVNWENLGAFYHDGGGTQVCIDPAPQLPARRFYRLTLSQSEP